MIRSGTLRPLLALAILFPASVQGQRTVARHAELFNQSTRWGTLDAAVSVSLERARIPRALEAIAQAAGIDLAYVSDGVPAGIRVSLDGRTLSARRAFENVLDGTGLHVRGPTTSGHYVVVPNPPAPAAPVQVQGSITGRVFERSSGQVIADASIVVEETGLQTLSGADGRFVIREVPAGVWRLRAASIGYAEQTRTVEVPEGGSAAVAFAMETHAVSIDEIVVTGTVTPSPVKAVPTPITVIRATDIERQNLQSLDEVFRAMVPGGVQTVQSPGPGGYAEFNVRGISSLTVFSTIKVFIDGVEVENPAYLKAIDPSSVERVEVISGPQAAATYGSGAVSGVMQIFTKKGVPGQRRPVLDGSISVGTIDGRYVDDTPITQEYRVSVNDGAETFGYNVGGSWEQESPWIPDAKERGGNLYGSARLDLGRLTANVMLRYRGDSDHVGRSPRQAVVYQDDSDAPSTSRMDWHSHTFGVDLQYRAAERWTHRLALGFDGGSTEQYTVRPRHATPADTFNTLNIQDRRKGSVRYNTSYTIPVGANELMLTGGGDYATQRLVGFSTTSLPSTARPTGTYTDLFANRSAQTLGGAFAQAQLGIHERLYITLGAHGDMSEGQSGVEWSPRIGGSYVHSIGGMDLKLRAAYGSALIAPDPASKQGTVTPNYIILANPGLLPERQTGYDAGIELYWGNRASLSLTYFEQEARDLVSLVFEELVPDQPVVYQNQNVGRIRNRGWEAKATLVPTSTLELTTVIGAAKSTVESLSEAYSGPLEAGDELQRVPEWTAAATVAWRPFSGTTLNGLITHRATWIESDFETRIADLLAGTFTGNVKDYWVDYEPITKIGIGVTQDISSYASGFLRIENLTNNYNFEGNDLIDPRGREMQLGLRFKVD